MTRAAGNGNGAGNGAGRRGPTSTATIDPTELGALAAPARLARAIAITGNDVPAALRLLRQAGYPVSVRAGEHDDPEDGDGLYAAHPVNVSAAGFSYSAQGSPGHDECCATRRRGLYQGARHAGNLPYVWARIMTSEGRVSTPSYLMSADAASARVRVAWEDIGTGRYAYRLNVSQTHDRRIRDAIETVISEIAHDGQVPEFPAALAPSSRTPDGHIPAPCWEALPPGYGDTPGGPETDRLAARQIQADIAARSPQIALAWGASAAAPFAPAMRVQSCIWEATGPARRGKTTTMQIAAAVWGNPALPPDPGIMASWDATAKGPGRMLGLLGILPGYLDESGTADFQPADWARLVYSLTQGASRLMAETSGPGMRKTPGWQGFLFVSGNGTITDRITSGKYAGIPARVITLPGPFTSSADEARQLRAATEADYGYLGPAVLAAVTVDQMRAWWEAARESIGAPDGGTLGTTGEQLAAAVAGAVALDHVLGTGNRIAAAAARAARDYLSASAEPEPDRDRVLRTLAEYRSSNRFAWPRQEAYAAREFGPQLDGLQDDEWLYVYPLTWGRMIDETGVTERTVFLDLYGRGDLHVPDANRRKSEWITKGPRWAGRPPCYKVRLSALAPDDPADVDGQAPEPPGPGQDTPADPDPWAAERAAMEAYEATPAPALFAATSEQPPTAPAPADPAPASSGPSTATRPAWLAKARERGAFRTEAQWEAFERASAALDGPDIEDHPERLRILAALEGRQDNTEGHRGRIIPGPFAPRRDKRAPWFQPWGKDGIPPAVDSALIVTGWAWERDYSGPAVTLDRSGAWVAAAASVEVAHGALAPTGVYDGDALPRPGYYLVNVYPWTEPGMPAPLGAATPGETKWVPAPTMRLLRDLAAAGRWPDPGASDSLTGDPCRLAEWAGLTKELRRYAIELHGRDSGAYAAVKQAFGQSMSMLRGAWAEDTTMPRKVWHCLARRLDWPDHIQSLAAANMWRAGDECRQLTGPDLAPVAVGRNTDELVIPAAALDIVTSTARSGKSRPPVRLDPLGIELGTFKVKGREDW